MKDNHVLNKSKTINNDQRIKQWKLLIRSNVPPEMMHMDRESESPQTRFLLGWDGIRSEVEGRPSNSTHQSSAPNVVWRVLLNIYVSIIHIKGDFYWAESDHWFTNWCCWDSTDVTLANEDANSKVVDDNADVNVTVVVSWKQFVDSQWQFGDRFVTFYRTQVRLLPCLVTQSLTPSGLVLNFAQIVEFVKVDTLVFFRNIS